MDGSVLRIQWAAIRILFSGVGGNDSLAPLRYERGAALKGRDWGTQRRLLLLLQRQVDIRELGRRQASRSFRRGAESADVTGSAEFHGSEDEIHLSRHNLPRDREGARPEWAGEGPASTHNLAVLGERRGEANRPEHRCS